MRNEVIMALRSTGEPVNQQGRQVEAANIGF